MEKTDKEIELLLAKDEDFINSKKYHFSLKEALYRNPEGLSPQLICRFLKIDPLKFPVILQEVLDKLQKSILSY
jgi:hypothetical protein